MEPGVVEQVRSRAQHRCEYCHLPEVGSDFSFWIDHIVARKHSGGDDLSNLAWSCPFCNRHKGSNLAGIDQITGRIAPLFNPRINPRTDIWQDHFDWNEAVLVGNTATGRATIHVMAINQPLRIRVRATLMLEGHRF